jgi:hypothetical protein
MAVLQCNAVSPSLSTASVDAPVCGAYHTCLLNPTIRHYLVAAHIPPAGSKRPGREDERGHERGGERQRPNPKP